MIKRVLFFTGLCLLVLVQLIACAIATGVIVKQTPLEDVINRKDSSFSQTHGPLNNSIAPIIVTQFNTFSSKLVTVKQQHFDSYYRQNLTYYVFPANDVHRYIYTSTASWIGTTGNDIEIYVLEGSTITFTVNISSTDYHKSGYVQFDFDSSTRAQSCRVPVEPNKTNSFPCRFKARSNGYFEVKSDCIDAKIDIFSAKGTIRFLNNSKWIGKTSVGTSVGSSNLVTVFNDSSFQSMAEAKEYVLVADISRLGSYTAGFEGCMTVSQHRRPLIYAIPAVGVSVLLICEAIAVTFVCCCYFGLNKRKSETYQTL